MVITPPLHISPYVTLEHRSNVYDACMDRATQARFQRMIRVQPDGCWMWTGEGNNAGYGMFRPGPGQPRHMVHRWSYEQHVGPIPEGLDIDHACHSRDMTCPGGGECRHRRCCNPEHLEPVTRSENTIRQRHAGRLKTSCPKGHPYEGENLILRSDGKRRCRECDRIRKRKSAESSRP